MIDDGKVVPGLFPPPNEPRVGSCGCRMMDHILRLFDGLSIGVVVMNARGLAEQSNTAAVAMKGRYFTQANGRLRFLHSRDIERHAAVTCDLLAEAPLLGRSHKLLRSDAGSICIATRLPLPGCDRCETQQQMIMFREQKQVGKSVWRMLQHDLGLSYAETRLAVALHQHCDLRATADHLGLSKETVRTQLRAVFSKLGMKRQSEVVRVLERLLLLQI